MSFNDLLPSNRGFGLGGMIQEPFGHPADQPQRRGKKGRRASQGNEPFDYLDHMNTMPDAWRKLMVVPKGEKANPRYRVQKGRFSGWGKV